MDSPQVISLTWVSSKVCWKPAHNLSSQLQIADRRFAPLLNVTIISIQTCNTQNAPYLRLRF